jgi:hypothetical protein
MGSRDACWGLKTHGGASQIQHIAPAFAALLRKSAIVLVPCYAAAQLGE